MRNRPFDRVKIRSKRPVLARVFRHQDTRSVLSHEFGSLSVSSSPGNQVSGPVPLFAALFLPV